MPIQRLRMFAGPNGSGKTTILNNLKSEIPLGVIVNADEIEKYLAKNNNLFFDAYNIIVDEKRIQDFFKKSRFSPVKRSEPDLWTKINVAENVLQVACEIDSYLAADIADFIRYSLLEQNSSFTFETVMSHNSKLEFIKEAKRLDYRIYLYFSATEDPLININRVGIRVSQKGHNVEDKIIVNRYYKSLALLKEAIKLSDRAYILDNSGSAAVLFAEITNGDDLSVIDELPAWFYNAVLKDND